MNYGPGDPETYPRTISSTNDPDYDEWDEECAQCWGSGRLATCKACDATFPTTGDFCPNCGAAVKAHKCGDCDGSGIVSLNNIGGTR